MWSSKACRFFGFGVFAALLVTAPKAEVNLERLSACDQIKDMETTLRDEKASLGNCRQPRNVAERALLSRNGGSRSNLCILRNVPADLVTGFSCVHPPDMGGSLSLLCIRVAPKEDIETYQKEYQQVYAPRATSYLRAIERCSTTNGAADFAPATTLSPILAVIAKMEFGFMAPLGKGRTTRSYVQHGYATTDPTLETDVPRALEFISVLIDGNYIQKQQPTEQKIGHWKLTVDQDEDKNVERFTKQYSKKTGVAISPAIANYTLENTVANASLTQKISKLGSLRKKVVNVFLENGFDELSASELKGAVGHSPSEVLKTLQAIKPYGLRSVAMRQVDGMTAVLKQDKNGCTQDDLGMLLAYIFISNPIADSGSDFGEIGIVLTGAGKCGEGAASRRYIKTLIEDAGEAITQVLKD